MKLSFHGGTREVTGACYLLETGKARILFDCGLFQGGSEADEFNVQEFGFDPTRVDALVVTHGHLDHVGRIPRLVKEGFRGPIYSTAPTRDLARVMLEDALGIAERSSEQFYERRDIEWTFSLWRDLSYQETISVGDIRITLTNAGHILGSSLVLCEAEGKKVFVASDLGNMPSVLLPSPVPPRGVTHLIIESTYGNRSHESVEERDLKLERAVEDAAARRGTLMIPAFATERTQDILFLLNQMLYFKRIPEIPVFVDSPLAIRVTEVFERYTEYYKDEIKDLYMEHPNLFRFKKLRLTERTEESKEINGVPPPKVIIAGSGMLNGGRILHHLKRYLPDEKSILLMVGYQSAGSLGRRLIDGDDLVKIFGEDIPVRAEIRKVNGFSAHADNPELFSFVQQIRDTLTHVFMVHGEEAQALHFMHEVRDRLGVAADAPTLGQEFEL